METYIVRVYPRKHQHPNRISGHVVKIEVKERQDFFDSEMLMKILEPIVPDKERKGSPPSLWNGNGEAMSMADLIRAIAEEEKL